jgi:hypothetical protein
LNDHIFIFRDIALVLACAFLGGLLFWRLRQPLILGYVLAGLMVSPLTPGPRVHDVHAFETIAEVGVILLMFSVGIEFSIPDLLRSKWVALLGAPIGISHSIGLGFGAGKVMGWPVLQSIAVGSIISVASTMVLSRLLMDRGELTGASRPDHDRPHPGRRRGRRHAYRPASRNRIIRQFRLPAHPLENRRRDSLANPPHVRGVEDHPPRAHPGPKSL